MVDWNELREKVAIAIRADGSDLCDRPWGTLSAEQKIGWLGDADRALAVVKDHLTTDGLEALSPSLKEQVDRT